MPEMPPRRAILALGGAQCVLWGLLYYGYAVLIVPLQRDLGASRFALGAVFSLGLLAMALAAPGIGRRLDRGEGRAVVRVGVGLAVSGLLLLAASRSLGGVVLAWLLLGPAMACLLYEVAFGLLARAIETPAERLRAASAVTVFGGLASTLCLAPFALAVEALGWRGATMLAAVAVLAAAAAMEAWVFPALPQRPAPVARGDVALPAAPGLAAWEAYFVCGTLAAMAVTVLLVPLLVDRGVAPAYAAGVLGLLGLSQLPGRLWLLHGRAPSGRALLQGPLYCHAAGLALLAFAPGTAAVAAGVVLFGLGAGLQTLARPWLLERRYGRDASGAVNGRLARAQGLARAAGPLLASGAAVLLPGRLVLAGFALLALALLPLTAKLARPLD